MGGDNPRATGLQPFCWGGHAEVGLHLYVAAVVPQAEDVGVVFSQDSLRFLQAGNFIDVQPRLDAQADADGLGVAGELV